jgi:MerR family copper efflux transcriptional regulator
VLRVRFVKRAQELGFTLKEIKELLSLRAAPRTRCVDVRARAEAKVKDIDDKVRTLQAMRRR